VPPAGQPIERGDVVLAYLNAPQDSIGRSLPDLVGLPVREAVRRLSLREVRVRITGNGFVTRQEPSAGAVLPLGGPCRLWCAPASDEASSGERTPSAPSSPIAARVRRP
jgi:beta-lactam-binding protein with PASTA domain